MSALGPNEPNPALNVLSDEERLEYNSLSLRLTDTSMTDTQYKRYWVLRNKIDGKGGKSRRNPSKKRPTARRHRSSNRKVRKARTTRRKH